MPASDYMNLFFAAGITDRRDQEKYGRRLDAVVAEESIARNDIIGVGEKGTGGNCDLYAVHRQGITLAAERGLFSKSIVVERQCPVASIANLSGTQEGFKGNEVALTGTDQSGDVVLRIVWGLGGPDWVEPLILRQRQHLFEVISRAMDELGEGPKRPSVAHASSKAGALMDWAADVVKAAGVPVTRERVEEHANMIAAVVRMMGFLPLARLDDLNKLYPSGRMPDGSPITTFDSVYEQVVAKVGNAQVVDQEIDRYLAGSWTEYVNGCRQTYSQ